MVVLLPGLTAIKIIFSYLQRRRHRIKLRRIQKMKLNLSNSTMSSKEFSFSSENPLRSMHPLIVMHAKDIGASVEGPEIYRISLLVPINRKSSFLVLRESLGPVCIPR